MKNAKQAPSLSVQIADAIRAAIVEGALLVGDRLPSEAELAEQHGVSRATVREALKRLAAQSLIRTERGAFGGAFINHLSYDEARPQQVTTSTLLLGMNAVSFQVACEARYALERSCTSLAAERRTDALLDTMRSEIARQSDPDLTDEAFCASDVAFHRALVDSAANEVLSYHLAGSVEAMQPLMNMITFTARSRAEIVRLHHQIVTALVERRSNQIDEALTALEHYTITLGQTVMQRRRTDGMSKDGLTS
ncbi:GntR family transcriptional regulator [Marivita sp. S6314]|uniref:FadR/GntR family transcriptional regulator n=1 Tax=Marivita sp. S6314 TaxID=2926406 RepID=UPI001FF53233|nr:GntR family transcriptional regulator [Marivita sp. S6314]MCK0148901.1 GntR family transcriptional regulator [Marivita sp. S6314]